MALDAKLPSKVTPDYLNCHMRTLAFDLLFEGKPENYVRERYTGRTKSFYNKKGGLMNSFKKRAIDQIQYSPAYRIMQELLKDKENFYSVRFDVVFNIPIPKNDSKIKTALKEEGCIRPTQRPDLDNYIKFVLDSLHGVFYNDDCRVTEIFSRKKFSTNPRTELTVLVTYLEN